MIFDFHKTEPLTPKFEQFKMSDLNFFNNSGSILIMQVLIVFDFVFRKLINWLGKTFSRVKCFRKLAILFYNPDKSSFIGASQRLFMEGYFDIVMCCFINLQGFIIHYHEIEEFTSTRDDIMNSIVALLYTFLMIGFPIWTFLTIWENFKRLKEKRV